MKILFVSPYPPYPPTFGGSTRIFNLMRQIGLHHEVISLSYPSTAGDSHSLDGLRAVARRVVEVQRPAIDKRWAQARSLVSRRSFQRISHYTPAMQAAIDRVAAEEQVDVIVAEFSQMAIFDFPPGPALIVDEHNIESDLIYRSYRSARPSFRKLYNLVEAHKFRREELELLRKADMVTVTSDRDGDLLLESVPDLDVAVIANGVDTEYFKPGGGVAEPATLVFTGAMHYHPNVEAALYFLDEVLPLVRREVPHVRFIAAGGNPPAELTRRASEHVVFTGYVDDMRDIIAKAAVFVVPLLVGGGTRFKVVEAMASGKAVVSTSLGAEGIPATQGKNILIADDPRGFATAVVALLREPERVSALAAAGRRFVETRFSWDVIGRHFEKVVQRIADREVVV